MAKIFPLSEGAFTVGQDKTFVPFNIGQDELTDRPTGSLLVEIQPFLVDTGKDLLVFDTGLRFTTNDGILQIHDNIIQAGYKPGDVTKELMSHLHKDHADCLVYKDMKGMLKPTFANAKY